MSSTANSERYPCFGSSVRHGIRMLCIAAVTLTAGCFTIEKSNTEYPEHKTSINDGPGGEDGELYRFVRSEREVYTGERTSIGLFPGFLYYARTMKVRSVKRSSRAPATGDEPITALNYVGDTIAYIVSQPIAHCYFCFPTIYTLLVEPFATSEDSYHDVLKTDDMFSMGLIGAYRWKVKARTETKEDYSENVLMDRHFQIRSGMLAKSVSEDGATVYFEYPGFRKLKESVDADGKVDVVFSDGRRIRRFSKSDRNADHLVYADRDAGSEAAVLKLFQEYEARKLLKEKIEDLPLTRGYALLGESQQAEASRLRREFLGGWTDIQGYSKCPIGVFESRYRDVVDTARKLDDERIAAENARRLAEAKAREERQRAMRAEKQKRIEELLSAEKFEEAMAECEQKDGDSHLWQSYLEKARQGAARQRIKAFDDLVRKAAQGDPDAQLELGRIYAEGNEAVKRDVKKARKWLRSAYDNGKEAAWGELEKLMEVGE